MSTLSGIASKGEKGKSKFQSLDINSLYRGESLEPHQAKSTLPRKHGMQSLGKVPSARRPPANLPSLKSEHSGNDPAISLVPTGGTGWGNKPGETGPPGTPQQSQQQEAASAATAPLPAATPPQAAPVVVTPSVAPPIAALVAPTQGPPYPAPPVQVQQIPHLQQQQQQQQQHGSDKSWSSIMAGPGEASARPPNFLAHQSAQFQQEFPKLSSGDGQVLPTGQKGGSDSQYGPGPSLRPQTEGSWIQGGGRNAAGGPMPGPPGPPVHPGGADAAGARSNSGQPAPQGAHMGQAGHAPGSGPGMQPGPIPHQFRGVLPQFMYSQRGNFPGNFPVNFAGGPMGPPRHRMPAPGAPHPGSRPSPRHPDPDEVVPRPIIKEEELSKMDDIARDPGWATHDDIDYNQTLAFSDDEDSHKEEPPPRKDSRTLIVTKEEKRAPEPVEVKHPVRQSQDARERGGPVEHRERSGPPDNRVEQRERSGPPEGRSMDQRERSGPPEGRGMEQRGPPQDQRGWQQGRQMPPSGDFRGGPPVGPPHMGPQPIVSMRVQPPQGPHVGEDEEIWHERRRQQSEEVANAVVRAKQRKEEEEKRYEETRQAAWQKLQILEQKMGKGRTSESADDAPGPGPGPTTTIPLPDWEKERESRERDRSRTSSEGKESDKAADIRLIAQTGERNAFLRSDAAPGGRADPGPEQRDRDRGLRDVRSAGEQQPVFSGQFQTNLPPRFQKQQAERSERSDRQDRQERHHWAGSGPAMHFPGQMPGGGAKPVPRRSSEAEREAMQDRPRDGRDQMPERPRDSRDQMVERPRETRDAMSDRPRENREQMSDRQRDARDPYRRDGGRGPKGAYYESGQDYQRSYHEREHADRLWERDPRQYQHRREPEKELSYEKHGEEEVGKEWREERPQRPDSRSSRESRGNEEMRPVEYHAPAKVESWADAPFDPPQQHYEVKEDKKKSSDYYRGEERSGVSGGGRHAPGPITREKMEAAGGEMKRSLTQLRRGNAAPAPIMQGERKPDAKLVDGQDKKERRSPTQQHGWGGQAKSLAQLHLEGGGQRAKEGGSKLWADALPDPEPVHEGPKPPGADRPEGEVTKKADPMEVGIDDGSKSHGRSSRGANWTGGYPVPPRTWGAPPPPARGRRVGSGSRSGARSNKGWPQGSESEYSESEVAGDIGKEDNAREDILRKERDSKPGKKSDRDAARREADGRRCFAPRGEPSRRGRGGFRARGGVAGRRMDGYGPPSSKSPFGGHEEKKSDGKEDLEGELVGCDDKIKKQHGPSAGVIGSGPRSGGQHPASSGVAAGKTRSRDAPRRTKAPTGDAADENNREWETTSENSDGDDAAKKSYGGRDGSRRLASGSGARSSRGAPIGPAPGNRDRQQPPGEKRSNNGYGRERNSAPSSSGSANGRPTNRGKVPAGKDGSVAIQRLDEIKIHDPALMVAALADLNAQKKAARPEKDKSIALEGLDLNNFASVVIVDDHPAVARDEERFPFDADNGFQEVRSKKNVKEARKVEEPAPAATAGAPHQKGAGFQGGRQNAGSPVIGRAAEHKDQRKIRPLLQDVRSQAPSREGNAVSGTKSPFERPRQNKLPPRLAKQKENNRLQKQQQQQQHHGMHNDVCEMNSINQNISLFPVKEQVPAVPAVNAWDKPLQANSPGANVGQAMQLGSLTNQDVCMMDPNEEAGGAGSHRSTPNGDKMAAKMAADKAALDGSSAPVQTIIFENTNYKTSPGDIALKAKFNHLKSQKSGHKMDDGSDGSLGYGGKTALGEQLGGGKSDGKGEAIQMPMSFAKEDGADMKLDFTFDSELSQLTDDKKSVGSTRSMHNMAPGGGSQQQQLSTADLNFKIASVKKVWENMPTVQEQTEDGNMVSSTFANVEFGKPNDCQQRDDGSPRNAAEMVYAHHPHSPGPQMQGNPYGGGGGVVVSAVPSMGKGDLTSTTSNVCKVKPQQQPQMSVQGHPGPLSPPPFNSANQGPGGHINYQAALGGGGQFGGISAIPSPPTVLYNSSPQMPSQGGLYGGFQIDGSQVLGGQARSQFSQFPPYGMSQGLGQTTAYNQQSIYMPHPPPSNAPQDHMYQSPLSQYRLQAAQGPFGQSQQLSNNPSTVLISSSSNSLMSASVKPSSQIGAIGTKGGVPYQTASMPNAQQTSQMYIQYDPSQVMGQNYLSGSQLVQRSGPVQNNVVPSIQASSSYYSGSAGQGGFYQPATSGLQPGQVQGGGGTGSPYGLQGYNAPSGNAAMQSFGSQFLSSPLQMAQPYRGNPNVPVGAPPSAYLKTSNQHVMSDHSASANGRAQLKSPSSNEQVMQSVQSVFSGTVYPPQIPSPKSRGMKSASSATASPPQPHHKLAAYGSVQSAVQSAVQMAAYQRQAAGSRGMPAGMGQPPPQRYPPPIQRPNVAYQPPPPNAMNSRHRPQHRPPPVNKMQAYYAGHGSNLKMESSSDSRPDGNIQQSNEPKLTDVGSGASGATTGSKPPQPADSKKPIEGSKDDTATSAAAAAME